METKMEHPLTDFLGKAKGLTRNPLGVIALFISLIYGFACLVLSTSISNLETPFERMPLIWFIIIFPFVILVTFTFLVVKHHTKLYVPGDYKDEKNFINAYIGQDIPSDLNVLISKLNSLKDTPPTDLSSHVNETINLVENIKEKSEIIPINTMWNLNHWGSKCATIISNKIVFIGTSAPSGKDGAHFNLTDSLEIGKTYEISCFAKSDENTTGMFQLWCHDNTGVNPFGFDIATDFKTPSISGEKISLYFIAKFNKSVRIHLQYIPGKGRIIVGDVKINEAHL
jgi:hypothetical protein